MAPLELPLEEPLDRLLEELLDPTLEEPLDPLLEELLDPPLEELLEPPLDVPLDPPLEVPLEPPLDVPLDPPDDPEPLTVLPELLAEAVVAPLEPPHPDIATNRVKTTRSRPRVSPPILLCTLRCLAVN